jgi:hypothetical protein
MIEAKSSSLIARALVSKGSAWACWLVHAMENPQVIERGDDTGMKFAVHGLVNLQHLQLHRLRLHILPFAGIDLRQL